MLAYHEWIIEGVFKRLGEWKGRDLDLSAISLQRRDFLTYRLWVPQLLRRGYLKPAN